MKSGTISSSDFLAGKRLTPRTGRGTHNLTATWDGHGIVVLDPERHLMTVSYASSVDRRTCYAYIENLGFIGGWQYPHKGQPFRALVESINRGVLYFDMNSLPNGREKKTA